jgi:hypothetical protein
MELKSISFQRYKAFPGNESIDIRPLTVLIGRNSSGKSVIARLPLLLARAFSSQAEAPIELNFNSLDFGASFIDLLHNRSPHGAFEVGATIASEGGSEYVRAKVQYFDEYKLLIVSRFYYYHSPGDYITLKWTGSDPLKEANNYQIEELGAQNIASFQGLFPNIQTIADQKVSSEFRRFQKQLESAQSRFAQATEHMNYLGPFREEPKRTYRFPGGIPRHVGPGGTRAPEVLFDAKLRRGGMLSDAVGTWFKKYLGGWPLDVSVSTQGDTFSLVLRNPQSPSLEVNVVDAGTGIAQVLPIIVQRQFDTLSEKPDSIEIIEQPELHLHPGVHGHLADLYIDAVNHSGVRFLIETHSENFLLRIRRRVAEGKLNPKKVMIYWVKDEVDAKPRIKPISIDTNGEVDDWPTGVFSEDFQEVRAIRKAQQADNS